jgi:hypothetical protein
MYQLSIYCIKATFLPTPSEKNLILYMRINGLKGIERKSAIPQKVPKCVTSSLDKSVKY